MARFRLTIEYDGTPFFGWQRQAELISVQECVENAIAAMSGEAVTIQASGRTDRGVHALGQVVSFDLVQRAWEPRRMRDALNYHLKPYPIAVIEAAEAAPDFEARFSALSRSYQYRILNRRARPALEQGRVWHVPVRLDAEAMHRAAQLILGLHDFTTFRAAECQANSPLRTLDLFSITRQADLVIAEVSARSFLHSQVRSMVGSLKLVGTGKWSPEQFRAALDARDRSKCGALAPPEGLYLSGVEY